MSIFFPDGLERFIQLNRTKLNEIRIRCNKPIRALVEGKWQIVTYKGTSIVANKSQIVQIVKSACENSIYAYNDTIKKGYVTTMDGIRLGICGKCITSEGDVFTITDFTSLCIRFPNQIIGCSTEIYKLVCNENIKNTLIISPPGAGKTTALRDLARLISINTYQNILIIDEREEIYNESYDLGETCDILQNCDKKFGFFSAIRNLCPNVIIVDELSNENDAYGIEFAIASGVKVIASVHGNNYNDILKKRYLKKIVENKYFDCIISLNRNDDLFFISEVIENVC